MLPLSIHFTDTRILHQPSFAKINNPDLRTIQTQLLRFPKSFPEKTDIGTVKMVKDHCEAIAR